MMAEEGTHQLLYVQETVLRKRKVNEDWAVKSREQKAARRQTTAMPIKKPQDFVREFCNKVDLVRMGTRLKVHKPPPVTDGLVHKPPPVTDGLVSKLIRAIRIPGTMDLHPHMRKMLRKRLEFVSNICIKSVKIE
uniref:Uncharacterized protein n=1 Tax=Oryza rufipogon TaxID=4529 RepID=A0A0E0R779_ORYRU